MNVRELTEEIFKNKTKEAHDRLERIVELLRSHGLKDDEVADVATTVADPTPEPAKADAE